MSRVGLYTLGFYLFLGVSMLGFSLAVFFFFFFHIPSEVSLFRGRARKKVEKISQGENRGGQDREVQRVECVTEILEEEIQKV